jgi:hypothetical protein
MRRDVDRSRTLAGGFGTILVVPSVTGGDVLFQIALPTSSR